MEFYVIRERKSGGKVKDNPEEQFKVDSVEREIAKRVKSESIIGHLSSAFSIAT